MERKIIGRTEKCLVCLKEATHHSGNVIKDDKSVIAGWCEEHSETYINKWRVTENYYYLANTIGCFGGWLPEYGLKDETP